MRAVLIISLCMIIACVASSGGGGGSRPSNPNPRPRPTSGPTSDPTSSPNPGADGAKCSTAADCTSGVCEGEGCGDGNGTCARASRACTRDARQYCGCDGKTFTASGSCPGQRFSARAACGS